MLVRIENLVIIALALENTSQDERCNRISSKYPRIVLHQVFNVYLGGDNSESFMAGCPPQDGDLRTVKFIKRNVKEEPKYWNNNLFIELCLVADYIHQKDL